MRMLVKRLPEGAFLAFADDIGAVIEDWPSCMDILRKTFTEFEPVTFPTFRGFFPENYLKIGDCKLNRRARCKEQRRRLFRDPLARARIVVGVGSPSKG